MAAPYAGASILRGVGRAISHISKSRGLTDWSFGLHIFDRLLLFVALGIPVMPIVNRNYLKLVLLYVYVNSTQLSIAEILATALEYPNHTEPKSKTVPSCLAQTR